MAKISLKTVMRVSMRSAGLMLGTGVLMQSARAHACLSELSRREHDRQWWLRSWAKVMLMSSATRVHVRGNVPGGKRARLVVANHRTPLDIPLLMSLFGGRVLSKSDVAMLPVLGRAARWAGTIFVDRDDRKSGARAIREIREALKSEGTVSVFPGGTTFGGDDVRPFRAGAFAAARSLDVEVVPVGIAYDPGVEFVNENFSEHMSRIGRRNSTSVCVRIGSPLDCSGGSSSLADAAREAVQQLVIRARHDWQGFRAPAAALFDTDPLLPNIAQ